MKHVGIKQARQELPALITEVEGGAKVVITRSGRPVAQLVAAPRALKKLPALDDFRSRMARAGTAAAKLVRQDRDAR